MGGTEKKDGMGEEKQKVDAKIGFEGVPLSE